MFVARFSCTEAFGQPLPELPRYLLEQLSYHWVRQAKVRQILAFSKVCRVIRNPKRPLFSVATCEPRERILAWPEVCTNMDGRSPFQYFEEVFQAHPERIQLTDNNHYWKESTVVMGKWDGRALTVYHVETLVGTSCVPPLTCHQPRWSSGTTLTLTSSTYYLTPCRILPTP